MPTSIAHLLIVLPRMHFSISYKYSDKLTAQDGIKKMKLKAGGPGLSKLGIVGKGSGIPVPALPLTEPVTTQLKNSNGKCWEAVVTAPTANTALQLKGISD